VATLTGQGSNASDSSTGSAASAVLAAGGTDQTLDFGFVLPLAVGDYVFVDTNGNGIQDAGDTPIAGITVRLLTAGGAPVTDAAGIVVAAVVTGANGAYHFDNLLPGSYAIQFSGAPTGYNWTSAGAVGSMVANDSNPNSSGLTPVFVLEADSLQMRLVVGTDGTLVATLINSTIDAGLVPPAGLSLPPSPLAPPTPGVLPIPGVPPINVVLPVTGFAVQQWALLAGMLSAIGLGLLLVGNRRRGTTDLM